MKHYYINIGDYWPQETWRFGDITSKTGLAAKDFVNFITDGTPLERVAAMFRKHASEILDPDWWTSGALNDDGWLEWHDKILQMILEHEKGDKGPILWVKYAFRTDWTGEYKDMKLKYNTAWQDNDGGFGPDGYNGWVPFNFDDLSNWGLFTDDSIEEVRDALFKGSIAKIMSNENAVRALFPNGGNASFIWSWFGGGGEDRLTFDESKRIVTRMIEDRIRRLGIKRNTFERIDENASHRIVLPIAVFNRVSVVGQGDTSLWDDAVDIIDIFDMGSDSYNRDLRPHLQPGEMGMAEEYAKCRVPLTMLQGKGIGDPNTPLRLINQRDLTLPDSMIELIPANIDTSDPNQSPNGDLLQHLWALGDYKMGGDDDRTDDYTQWQSESLDHSLEGFMEWANGLGDFLFGLFVDQPTLEDIHNRLYSKFIMELILWDRQEPVLEERENMNSRYGYTPEDFFYKVFEGTEINENISGYSDIRERNVSDNSWVSVVSNLVLHELETQRRIGSYNNLCTEEGILRPDIDPDGGFEQPEAQAALAEGGVDGFAGAGATEDVEEEDPLSDEDIEERQKFFKQCALMINAHKLKQQLRKRYTSEWQATGKNSSYKPYDGRFWMAGCNSDQERLINNLISSEDGKEFFNVPPAILSYLVPKLRLFKVENNDNKSLTDTEFIFSQYVDLNRDKNYSRSDAIQNSNVRIPSSYLEADFDKGDGCGVRDFSLSFEVSPPATSRTDIKAKLELYFQTFADLLRERISYNGRPYRYIDLILQPKPDEEKGTINGIEITHPNQYDPSFYRIRAEVGYNPIDENPPIDFQGWLPEQWTSLKQAILRTNRAYYLCMVDHDINVNNDGTVNVTISYQAYVETAMKSLRFDALTTRALLETRKEGQRVLKKMIEEENCTNRQINKFKELLSETEEELRKQSLRSILTRLLMRDKIYGVKINEKHAKYFRKNGFFGSCELKTLSNDDIPDALNVSEIGLDVVTESLANTELTDALESDMPSNIDYADKEDVSINFFFFGDLLHTILDCSYDIDGIAPGMENTKILLGSLDFSTFLRKGDSEFINPIINLAEIPVSVDYFMQWFTENVIQEGETRKSFPVIYFVRNMCNTLLKTSLLENCVHRRVETNLRFQTGQISAFSPDGRDPFGKLVGAGEWIVNTDLQRRADNLPLLGDANQELRDLAGPNGLSPYFYNYLVVNVIGSSLTYTGRGNYNDDVKDGRYHIDIGSNRGIVKTVKFSKTDIQYLREARFMRQGIDGLQQLANVYKADIEMYGNSLFYPGMELYINPYGIGGTELGSPTQGPRSESGRSLANTLGVGGYHTIVSVKSSISRGKYTTNIGAQWYYSGDGQPNPGVNGAISAVSTKDIEKSGKVFPDDQDPACKNLYLEGVGQLSDLEQNPYLGMEEVGVNNIENLPPDLTQAANIENYADVGDGGSSTIISNPDGASYNLPFKDDSDNMYSIPYDKIVHKDNGVKEYWFDGQKSGVTRQGFNSDGVPYTELEILQGKFKGQTVRSTFIEPVSSDVSIISSGETGGLDANSSPETSEEDDTTTTDIGYIVSSGSGKPASEEDDKDTGSMVSTETPDLVEEEPEEERPPQQPMSQQVTEEEKILVISTTFDLKNKDSNNKCQKIENFSDGTTSRTRVPVGSIIVYIRTAGARYYATSGKEYKSGVTIKGWCPGDLGVNSKSDIGRTAISKGLSVSVIDGNCNNPTRSHKSRDGWTYRQLYQWKSDYDVMSASEKAAVYRDNPPPWVSLKLEGGAVGKVTLHYDDNTSEIVWRP